MTAPTIGNVTIPTYTTEGTAVPEPRRWPLSADPLHEFNLRSLGMTGPYGVAVGLSCAALTAGAALADHQVSLHPQAPAAKVRIMGPGTASPMTLPPVEAVQDNIPLASGAPPGIESPFGLNYNPDDPESSIFTFKK